MTDSEVKICARVRDWLRGDGWKTYQEVPTRGGRVDIVAVRSGLVWLIEAKKTCSLALVGQMLERERHSGAHGVLAAVPRPSVEFRDLCARLGFGVIDARDGDRGGIPSLVLWPDFHRQAKPANLLRLCTEEAAQQDGGASGGAYWTPFKRAVRELVEHFYDLKIERMPLGEAARLTPIRQYKGEKAEETALRRWLIWAIEQGLVPGFSTVGKGKERAVVFDAAQVSDEQREHYQIARRVRETARGGAVAGSTA